MRKIILILPAVILYAVSGMAQTSIEFVPTAGYTFASRTDYYSGYGRVADGFNFGGSINFNINRSTGIEVFYNHMSTTNGLYYYDHTPASPAGNINYDYIMIGPVQSFTIQGSTVRPFFGALLGAAILTPDVTSGSGYENETKFAVGVQLGTNIYVSPHVGLQLKAQMLSPVDAAGGSFFFGSFGSGAGLSTYSSVYQFSLNAGLIIGLGKVLPEPQYHRPAHRPGPHYRRYYY